MAFLKSPFWEALGLMGGMIIGSGMFALPYAVSVSGLWAGMAMAALAFFLVLSMHLAYGEIVANSLDRHRLPGYAKMYLGRFTGNLSRISELLLFNTALLTYAILGGLFLSSIFGGASTVWSLLFFLFASLILFFEHAEQIGIINLFLTALIGLATIFISASAFRAGSIANIPLVGRDPFFSFGVFVFALTGLSVIADARDIFRRGNIEHKLKPVVILATAAPFVLYLIFIFSVLMATGSNTSQEVLAGLGAILGSRIILVGMVVGASAMFSSFLALGYDLRKIYELDLGIPRVFSWALGTLIPAAVFLFGVGDFTKLISIMGGIFVSIDGFLVILILSKMRSLGRIKKYFLPFGLWQRVFLVATLFLSALYEIVYQVF